METDGTGPDHCLSERLSSDLTGVLGLGATYDLAVDDLVRVIELDRLLGRLDAAAEHGA